MKYNAASTTCETFAYGEVEDYCVVIEEGNTPPPVCNTPTGLSASSITTSSAVLSFNSVSNAVSYNLDYKLSSSSTWNTASVSATSNNLTGLSSATSYDLRVQTVCSFGSSSYSSVVSFTTSAAPSTCNDTYESNN